MEYNEELILNVTGSSDREQKCLFSTQILGKKTYNSWFYFAFEKTIFIHKCVKCCIEVIPKDGAKYQLVEKISKAECSVSKIQSSYKFYSWSNCHQQNNIIKSVTLVPY